MRAQARGGRLIPSMWDRERILRFSRTYERAKGDDHMFGLGIIGTILLILLILWLLGIL